MNKLLTIYYTHKPGGLCKRLYRLIDGLSERGVEVVFMTLDPDTIEIQNRTPLKKIPFPFKARSGLVFWALFSIWVPLYVLWWSIRHRGFHAFVFNPYYGLLIYPTRLLGLLKKITFFYRSVGSRTYRANKQWLLTMLTSLMERVSYNIADQVVTQTRVMHNQLSGNKPVENYPWHLLPNDVPKDLNPQKRAASDKICSLVIGKFDSGKNLDFLIECYSTLPEDKFELYIIGDGPAIPPLRAEIESNPHIHFVGWLSDLSDYYEKAQILIHPSHNEGMPNVVLEALGYELVILASDTPEMRELLQDESLLFSLKNNRDLPLKLLKLSEDPEYLTELKKLCSERKSTLSFDWEDQAAKLLA